MKSKMLYFILLLLLYASFGRVVKNPNDFNPRLVDEFIQRASTVSPGGSDSYLSICTLARNEGRYLSEWISFHLCAGVSHVFVFDDSSNDATSCVLQPFVEAGVVTVTRAPVPAQKVSMQETAFNTCLQLAKRRNITWMAFIDVDEFLFTVDKFVGLERALSSFEQHGALLVNWLQFGGKDEAEKAGALVVESYVVTHPRDPENPIARQGFRTVKSIVQVRYVDYMTVHCPFFTRRAIAGAHIATDVIKQTKTEHAWLLEQPREEFIRLNHYYMKSLSYFLCKGRRPHPNRSGSKYRWSSGNNSKERVERIATREWERNKSALCCRRDQAINSYVACTKRNIVSFRNNCTHSGKCLNNV